MKKLKLPNLTWQQLVIAPVVFISRVGFLPANLSPLGSFGFFGNPWLYGLTIVAFDVLVGGVYRGMAFTYLGFAAYAILGRLARGHIKRQFVLLPVASLLFFLVSNFGVFWYWYPHTLTGLLACYAAALPFYTRTLVGDVIFGYGYVLTQLYALPLVRRIDMKPLAKTG